MIWHDCSPAFAAPTAAAGPSSSRPPAGSPARPRSRALRVEQAVGQRGLQHHLLGRAGAGVGHLDLERSSPRRPGTPPAPVDGDGDPRAGDLRPRHRRRRRRSRSPGCGPRPRRPASRGPRSASRPRRPACRPSTPAGRRSSRPAGRCRRTAPAGSSSSTRTPDDRRRSRCCGRSARTGTPGRTTTVSGQTASTVTFCADLGRQPSRDGVGAGERRYRAAWPRPGRCSTGRERAAVPSRPRRCGTDGHCRHRRAGAGPSACGSRAAGSARANAGRQCGTLGGAAVRGFGSRDARRRERRADWRRASGSSMFGGGIRRTGGPDAVRCRRRPGSVSRGRGWLRRGPAVTAAGSSRPRASRRRVGRAVLGRAELLVPAGVAVGRTRRRRLGADRPEAARPAATAAAASRMGRLRTARFPQRLVGSVPPESRRPPRFPDAAGLPSLPGRRRGGGYLISFFAIFAATASLRSIPVCSLSRNTMFATSASSSAIASRSSGRPARGHRLLGRQPAEDLAQLPDLAGQRHREVLRRVVRLPRAGRGEPADGVLERRHRGGRVGHRPFR